MHNEYDENLLEPLKYYNNYLKGHFRKVTEDYFQELVDEAGIDIDKNTELMKEYEEASRNFSGLKSKLNRYLFTKKVIFIIGGGSLLWGGVNFFRQMEMLIQFLYAVFFLPYQLDYILEK